MTYKRIFVITFSVLALSLHLCATVIAGDPPGDTPPPSESDRCFFEGMPRELVSLILSFPEGFDLSKCARVSKCFRGLTWAEELGAFKEACEELEVFQPNAQADESTEESIEGANISEVVTNQFPDQDIDPKEKFFSNHCRLIRLWPYCRELLARLEQTPQDEALLSQKEDLRGAFQRHYGLLTKFWPEPDSNSLSQIVREGNVFDEKLALDTLCFCLIREKVGIFGTWPIPLKRAFIILTKDYGLPRGYPVSFNKVS